MRSLRLLASALALCALGTLPPLGAQAQQIHPINMVSGVDSVSSATGYFRTFYTVPSGQTFVLTDMAVEPTSNRPLLFDDWITRFVLIHIGAVGTRGGSYLSLSTGIVFQTGHQLTLQSFDNEVTRFSWSGYIVPEIVGVAPSEAESRIGFALTPNPSGQVVELRFELSKPADVSLRIYDVQGRLVTTLADARMPKGRHDFSWTGKTQQGVAAASGVYFARLESSELKSVKRLIRIR